MKIEVIKFENKNEKVNYVEMIKKMVEEKTNEESIILNKEDAELMRAIRRIGGHTIGYKPNSVREIELNNEVKITEVYGDKCIIVANYSGKEEEDEEFICMMYEWLSEEVLRRIYEVLREVEKEE